MLLTYLSVQAETIFAGIFRHQKL